MLKNYLKVAWRNLFRNKMYSALNVVGLATGMAAAIVIALWIWDEVSFNSYHNEYNRLAQVTVNTTNKEATGEKTYTGTTVSIPMGYELRDKYAGDFKNVALVSWAAEHIIAVGDKKISQTGMWVQDAFPEMFTLQMLKGNARALKDPSSVLLARSVANALFGDTDPINEVVLIDNKMNMKVAGIYDDLPYNTTNRDIKFLLPWDKYVNETDESIKNAQTQWNNHMCQLYVQLQDHADIDKISAKIKSVPTSHVTYGKEELFLQPMSKWHLYSEYKNGKQSGGRIRMVWMIGIIGLFILLLACINFMNLSTARSEKRCKEVGIRKAIGSLRTQLMLQFLSESLTATMLSLVLAILMVQLSLPWFNALSDKQMFVPWTNPVFWMLIVAFTFFTGVVSGSYPAFYLSGFKPVQVLKGTFKVARNASLPRKVLVVLQFTVSVSLMIGTFVVYKQIQYAKNRPVGYSREGLIRIDMNTPDVFEHYNAIRNDLLQTGAVADMAQSNSAPTQVWSNNVVEWKGKDPNTVVSFGTIAVSHDFGNTVGWKIMEGRDFSRSHASDTFSFILNETAAKMTGFKDPVGQTIRWLGTDHMIIGVVKDMVMESPYQPIRPTLFHLNPAWTRMITLRIKQGIPLRDGLAKVEEVFRKYNPGSPFIYRFTDEEYAKKFEDEQRIGDLTTIFAILAVLISCLGLFGLASFVAEQRTKEIGIRKVLGATVFNLWKMLSQDFVSLVIISCSIAIPVTWYMLNEWLKQYEYRTTISWWIFVLVTAGAILLTLATVSYQAIRGAVKNPVNSLKAE